MGDVIVQFSTQLRNISYFTSAKGKWEADTEGGRRMGVCIE